MAGTNGSIFAIGDCTATSYAPTAQVASQQGGYIARCLHQMAKRDSLAKQLATLEESFNTAVAPEEKAKLEAEAVEVQKKMAKVKLRPFHYSHQGSLAYIGSDKAIADLPFMNGNVSIRPSRASRDLQIWDFSSLAGVLQLSSSGGART